MSKLLRYCKGALMLLLSFMLSFASAFAQTVQFKNGVQSGVVRVKLSPQSATNIQQNGLQRTDGIIRTGIQSFDVLASQYGAMDMRPVFKIDPRFEEQMKSHGLHLWYEIQINEQVDPRTSAKAFGDLQEVLIGEPVFEKSASPYKAEVITQAEAQATTSEVNDTYLGNQWHYNNTGQSGGKPGVDINLFKAWEIEMGQSNVIVAVHDQNVDYTHEDLADAMWVNEAELNGQPGVDDDYNGYVDDLHGWSFSHNSADWAGMQHGTHVAGTVAATNNNGIGVSGVAGGSGHNDGARVMALGILSGPYSDIANSYIYAAHNGAVISQNSWGYTTPGAYEASVLDAIDYFIEFAGNYPGSPMKGGIVIFAAGNSNGDFAHYPGYYPSTMSVASVGEDGKRAYYSNYGSWVELTAPGGDQYFGGQDGGVLSTFPNDQYGYIQGTSMAAPHVAGVAALVVSKFGGNDFTSDQLWDILMASTNDVYAENPDFIGKLGVGMIDAEKALMENTLTAPDAVADLEALSAGKDYINFSWTAPADGDDHGASKYTLYYDTVAVDFATTQKRVIYDNSLPGETVSATLEGLLSTTTYHIAVVASDRWGNVSALSEEVTATTTEGGTIALDKSSISVFIDESLNSALSVTDTINVMNDSTGILRWDFELVHKAPALQTFALPLVQPAANAMDMEGIEVGKEEIELVKTASLEVAPAAFVSNTMSHFGSTYPSYIIGEEDTSIPNSSATHFYVSQQEGFNLTQVKSNLRFEAQYGPAVVEIRKGGYLDQAELVYTAEIASIHDENARTYTTTLDEHIYFEQGEHFWIIYHVPAGTKYTHVMVPEATAEGSDHCFMSFDQGNSWTALENAIYDDRWVWQTSAVSQNPWLGEYVTLSPSSGEIAGKASQEVVVSVDASKLINGGYQANLVFNSDDDMQPEIKVPFALDLTGRLAEISSASVVDMGSLFLGEQKEMEVMLYNTGYGMMKAMTFSSSDPQFTKVSTPYTLDALDSGAVKVRFIPTAAGFASTTITLEGSGVTHSFTLTANALETSEIALDQDSLNHMGLAIGDIVQDTVTIYNNGQYPLEFALPKFTEVSHLPIGEDTHVRGYSWAMDNTDSIIPYTWNDISSTGTDIASWFAQDPSLNHFYRVDLGFEFTFMGRTQDHVWISNFGAISMEDDPGRTNIGSSSPNYSGHPTMAMAAWMNPHITGNESIYYERQPGKLIVQFQDVEYTSTKNKPVTYQMILHADGKVQILYHDLSTLASYQYSYFLAALETPEHKGALIANDGSPAEYKTLTSSQTIYEFYSPGAELVAAVSEASGTVLPGDSLKLALELNTEALKEGMNFEHIAILSNDPVNSPVSFVATADVVSGGLADISLSQNEIDFGTVFQYGSRSTVIEIQNSGNAIAQVNDISLANGDFVLTGDTSFELPAKARGYITITLPTDTIASLADVLTISTSEGDFTATITAEVVEGPAISFDQTPVSETLEVGEMTSQTLTVSNTGAADLELAAKGLQWAFLKEAGTTTTASAEPIKAWTYAVSRSDQGMGTAYHWNDIVESGIKTGHDFVSIVETKAPEAYWKTVELPFSFEFYGQTYSEVNIGYDGLMSVGERSDFLLWKIRGIPAQDGSENLIAPYWFSSSAHLSNDFFAQTAGIYYEVFEDHVIVQWQHFINNFGMGNPISFQAIIYENGTIKFQYNYWDAQSDRNNGLGLIGVENADGTEGVPVSQGQHTLSDKLAITLSPVEKFVIPAGESKDFELVMDAEGLIGGDYSGELVLQNNSTTGPNPALPVNLTVNGAPEATLDPIDLGTVYAGSGDYEQRFEIANTGMAMLNVSSVSLADGTDAVLEYLYVHPFFGERWMPGGVTGAVNPGEFGGTMRILYTAADTVSTLADTLVVVSDDPDMPTLNVPVAANVVFQPELMIGDKSEIAVTAFDETHTENRSIQLKNRIEGSELAYELMLEFDRSASSMASIMQETATDDVKLQKYIAQNASALQATAMRASDFNRVLAYDEETVAETSLGFGPDAAFHSATRFVAPSEGFNLSHIQTWYTPGEWLDSRIKVEIRTGSDLYTATVLHAEEFSHTIEEADMDGSLLTFELSEEIELLPNESFFVVIGYPMGANYPQGFTLTESVPGNFYYGTGEAWTGLESFSTNASFLVKAAEMNAATGQWLSIDSPASGTVYGEDSVEVSLHFEAAFAKRGDMSAQLVIKSNDPTMMSTSVPVSMHLNEAPVFTMLTALLETEENQQVSFTFEAEDAEGDEITYELAEAYAMTTLSVNEGQAFFTYSPDFEQEGTHTFSITATDAYGAASMHIFEVAVANVNRAPVAADSLVINFTEGDAERVLSMAELFSDPEADELSYRFAMEANAVANAYQNGSELLILPKEEGTALLEVQATDTYGAASSVLLTIQVARPLSAENELTAKTLLYPNPTSGVFNIELKQSGKATVRVLNSKGTEVLKQTVDGDQSNKIDLSDKPNGLYLLVIETDNSHAVRRVIKQ